MMMWEGVSPVVVLMIEDVTCTSRRLLVTIPLPYVVATSSNEIPSPAATLCGPLVVVPMMMSLHTLPLQAPCPYLISLKPTVVSPSPFQSPVLRSTWLGPSENTPVSH